MTEALNTPVLVADIGGTNARIALARDGAVLYETLRVYRCDHFDGPVAAIRQFCMDQHYSSAGSFACIAIASPIDRRVIAKTPKRAIAFTNSSWRLTPAQLVADLGLSRLVVMNDFEAQAFALPKYTAANLTGMANDAAVDGQVGPCLVMGPGTGLGVAIWLPHEQRAISTEGGQASFAPSDAVEIALLSSLWKARDHVAIEHLISGNGLELLHATLHEGERLEAAQISAGAARGDQLCATTLQRFLAILAASAGNLALSTGARGGVYFAGGIMPRIASLIDHTQFRARFAAKGAFKNYLDEISLWLVDANEPGLLGAAAAAQIL